MIRQSMVAYGAPLERTEAETPTPQGSEVLVRVSHCGVCHSDLHLHDGYFDLGGGRQLDVRADRELPFTLGHEIAGLVEAAGPEAEGVRAGDRRVIYPWIGCGECEICARGDEHLCGTMRHLGIYVDGGYADHVMVPHPRYLLDYDGLDPALACTYMCSGLTAYSSIRKANGARPGETLMLVGLGGVGMMGVQFAKALHDGPLFVADIDPAKREAGLEAGAEAAFDPSDREARKAVLRQSGGVAAALDYVGSEGSLKFATGVVRKGGQVVVSGLLGGTFSMAAPMFPLRALSIIGNFVGSLTEAREMLEMVRGGGVAPIPVETRPLEAAWKSLEDLRAGKVVGRVVLTP